MRPAANVLVLIKGLGVGGAEKLISEAARVWDRDRFNYSVAYVLPWKDQLVGELVDLGVDVQCIGGPRGLTPATALRLRRLLRHRDIDIIHAHLPSMGVLARLTTAKPIVYTEHNMSSSYRPFTRLANRATYWRNRATVAVSDAVAESVTSWPGPPVGVIQNGVSPRIDPAQAEDARAELGVSPGSRLIAHVGNIRPGKGHDTLIDTAAELASRRSDVVFVSIGVEKYPGDLDRVRGRAEATGIAEQILFLGRRADALRFVGAADVYVNPSDVEGLPVAVLEAMSLAKPIVATAAGGVPKIIRDGETGILVHPGDSAALAKGIDRLLDDAELSNRLATAAQDLVRREYGLEPMVRAYEAIYEEVLNA